MDLSGYVTVICVYKQWRYGAFTELEWKYRFLGFFFIIRLKRLIRRLKGVIRIGHFSLFYTTRKKPRA
jgi:hypothetical protein